MGKTGVDILIGTRKGGYIASSDAQRRKWNVRGPFNPGADVFHVTADPRRPGLLFAAVNSPFWGPMIYRSKDGGHRWSEVAPPLLPLHKSRTPLFDPAAKPLPLTNIWHIAPGSVDQPKRLYVGVDPASLWQSDDLGDSWEPLLGLNEHRTRKEWGPGAGGLCLHTILLDPKNSHRMTIGISAVGAFVTEDGGTHWAPKNHGVPRVGAPEPMGEIGQCVHKMVLDPEDPRTIYRQDHAGIYVSHDGAENWKHVGKPLGGDFGFVTAAPSGAPGEAFFVPLDGMSRTSPTTGPQIYRWSERTRKFTPTVKRGQFPGNFGNHREGLAADHLDPFGLYYGTTTGDLFYSADGARTWRLVPFRFPAIHSVSTSGPGSGG